MFDTKSDVMMQVPLRDLCNSVGGVGGEGVVVSPGGGDVLYVQDGGKKTVEWVVDSEGGQVEMMLRSGKEGRNVSVIECRLGFTLILGEVVGC